MQATNSLLGGFIGVCEKEDSEQYHLAFFGQYVVLF